MVNSKLNRKLINSGDNALVGEPGFLKLPFVIIICFFCTVPLLSSIPPLLNPSPPQFLPSIPPVFNSSPPQPLPSAKSGHHELLFFWKEGILVGTYTGGTTLWFMLHMIDHPLPCMMIAVMGEATSCRIRPSAEEGSCPWNLPPGWSERSYHPGLRSDLILGEQECEPS